VSEYQFEEIIFHCITPLHVGCGQDVGIVDLPVVRERTTGYPYIPGSGIRGPVRLRCEGANGKVASRILGREADDPGGISSGCVSVLDARLLLFPVRSAPGIFHWITCPYVLRRYQDDRKYFLGESNGVPVPTGSPGADEYWGGNVSSLYMEEYPFGAPNGQEDGGWNWNLDFDGVDANRVVLVSDETFSHFVGSATIVLQRNRLSSAKTVVRGQLFSLEACPPETFFYGFFGATGERAAKKISAPAGDEEVEGADEIPLKSAEVQRELRKALTGDANGGEAHLILGGSESTGLGITKMIWKAGGSGKKNGQEQEGEQ